MPISPPWWKYYLSYLTELLIESHSSPYNEELYLSLRRGRYQLCTANAVYSYGDLYTNFKRAFQRIDLDRLPGPEVLVLGLGLGSIPYMLEKTFQRSFRYTAIEIDPVIIQLASQYVLTTLSSSITCIQADAFPFVQRTDERFDLICMDVFTDDIIPEAGESIDFLQNLRDLLTPDGVLLYNRLAATIEDQQASRAFFDNQFLAVFPAGQLLDVRGNYVLLNDSRVLR